MHRIALNKVERASISIAKGNYNMLRDNRTLPAG